MTNLELKNMMVSYLLELVKRYGNDMYDTEAVFCIEREIIRKFGRGEIIVDIYESLNKELNTILTTINQNKEDIYIRINDKENKIDMKTLGFMAIIFFDITKYCKIAMGSNCLAMLKIIPLD